MKNIVITGGAGFIGANTADYYLSGKKQVTIIDNLSRPGVNHNLDWLNSHPLKFNLKIIKADIADEKAITSPLSQADVVFHFAGQTAVTTSVANPKLDFNSNVLGTFTILEVLRQKNPQAILLYSSTNKVYGNLSRLTIKKRGIRYYTVESASVDESEPIDFYSPYGTSKGAGDQYVHDYARTYGMRTIVFRQSCIYGTHQFGVEDQGWLAHFTAQTILNKPINIFGDGKQVRDILFISDLIDAYNQAIKRIKYTQGEIYNIGGGINSSVSLLELIHLLEDISKRKLKLKFFPERVGDQKVYISNIDKACRDLDWYPKVSVTEGVKNLYYWLFDYLNAQK